MAPRNQVIYNCQICGKRIEPGQTFLALGNDNYVHAQHKGIVQESINNLIYQRVPNPEKIKYFVLKQGVIRENS